MYLKETLKRQEFLKKIIKEKQLVKIPLKGGPARNATHSVAGGGADEGWQAVKLGNASEAWGGELLVELEKGGERASITLDELINLNFNLF